MRASPMIPPPIPTESAEMSTAQHTRRNMYALLLLALLINFACIFLAMWLGLNLRPLRNLETSMLAQSSADYGDNSDFEFAPLDPTIAAESELDSANLRLTTTAVSETPIKIIPLPPTATASLTASPTPSPTPSATASQTAVSTQTA
ncbi:hypothetical protein MNBD_CHLOROFLEXI01-1864, partial [hydrothermal vent metagenome]